MLMLALASRSLDVQAITTVAGNVPLSLTSRNARMMADIMGRTDMPVYAGCEGPMLREAVTAEDFHGESGIAGIDPFTPETPLRAPHGIKAIISHLRASDGMTVVVTGPMTNLAYALNIAPDIHAKITHLVVMGGADKAGGNITPTAEFNIYADPHAAIIVFDAGLKTTVLSLDVTHQVRAEPERIARIKALGSQAAATMVDLLEAANVLEGHWKAGRKAPMHDPSTIIALTHPDLFSGRRGQVTVNAETGDAFGQTRFSPRDDGPHLWLDRVDSDGFFAAIEDIMGAQ